MKRVLSLAVLATFWPVVAQAAVTLLDKEDWKVQMSGFVETDIFHDTTRSLSEVPGSAAVARKGTIQKENGQTVFSIRNSRLAFSVLPPVQNDIKTKGYLEYDLLGYDPKPNTNAAATTGTGADAKNSESSFYTNPTLRVRHAYFSAERAGWSWLVGQTWTLFGWLPNYVLTTASVPPGPGEIYQRTEQVTGMKTLEMNGNKLQIGLSVARPSQRDSEMPNVDAGVRWSLPGYTAGLASPTGDVKAEALSVGLSGTWRQFVTPETTAVTSGQKKHGGEAVAVDLMVPILPASDNSTANSLSLTGEFSEGTGYGDSFPSWSGGLSQYPAGTTGLASSTNLDAGQGGFDSSGGFSLVKLRTFNAQLQYHLPGEMHTFVTLGYAQLNAFGIGRFSSAVTTYDQSSMMFLNVFHDCTAQIRTALEFARFGTHYIDGQSVSDDRIQLNGYFRF
jgi:hypothetical protein